MSTVHRTPDHSSEWPDSLPPAETPAPKPYRHRPEVPDEQQMLTTAEVAAIFRVDVKSVARWAIEGRIRSARTPGGRYRFRRADVDALLRGETPPAGDPAPRYAVRYPSADGTRRKRWCDTLDHARAVLSGLPGHYRPAEIVVSHDAGQSWTAVDEDGVS